MNAKTKYYPISVPHIQSDVRPKARNQVGYIWSTNSWSSQNSTVVL